MALARVEHVVSEVRIYHDSNAEWDAQHDICLLIRYCANEPGAADICMHSAIRPHTRASLRALLRALLDTGLHSVYAHRREGHRLPGAVMVGPNLYKVDLTKLHNKVVKV